MNISTFQDDLLGLEEFAQRLEKFINTEHDFVDGSLVIALTSKFGSGKTTFLRMWRASLESAGEVDETPLVISLNAWQSDYYGDPLFAIISALAESIQKEGQSPQNLLNAAKDYGLFATAISAQLVNKFTGVDPIAASDFVEGKKAKRQESMQVIPNTFTVYEGRKEAMESLKNAIRELISSSKPNVLFLVDELDRCRPDYAISYLETIKHIFDIKGAVFLLAADRQQLENSAKTAFGPELDFEEYYRKFVHREVTLPEISKSGYEKLATVYVSYYLEREDSRCCFMELERSRIVDISMLIGGFKLTPRQIQEVFRILGHIFETTIEKKGTLLWCIGVGTIVMAACKIGKPEIYHSLGRGQLDPLKAADFLKQNIGVSHIDWWLTLFFTGGGLHVKEDESMNDVMKKVGLVDGNGDRDFDNNLNQWYNGWGFRQMSNRFNLIYNNIQQIAQWD